MTIKAKIQAYAYVKHAQITASGYYELKECRICQTPIKSCKMGLCKDCKKIEREGRKAMKGDWPIERQARVIRAHREGRI